MRKEKIIAHFTPEIALHQEFPNYTGGLGVFSASAAFSAKKLEVPMVVVSMLYSEGYYDQGIEHNRMSVGYTDRFMGGNPDSYYLKKKIIEDTGVMFTVSVNGYSDWVKVYRLTDEAMEKYATVPVYYLTTDIPQNKPEARMNSLNPYGGAGDRGANMERKIAQSIILGCGGIEALKRLEIPVEVYHLNESHVAFAALQIFANFYRECGDADEARRRTREKVVFTTHTPVVAGNPRYGFGTVEKFLKNGRSVPHEVLARLGKNSLGEFDMATLGFRLSRMANAVSKRHREKAYEMWAWHGEDLPELISITNGTSQDFWQYPEFRKALNPAEMKACKAHYKQKMLDLVAAATGKVFRLDAPTLVFARRFAEYKRPMLLFSSDWAKQQLYAGKMQVVFAGKPHPDDNHPTRGMVKAWNDILEVSYEIPNLAILPGYELEMSKILKAGADIWLNNPRAPFEACGTSGMSAMMNGAIHMSTPDGWAREEFPENCFVFGTRLESDDQDKFDAEKLQDCIANALALYEHDKSGWYEKAFDAKREAEENWTSDRMLAEYCEKMYELQ